MKNRQVAEITFKRSTYVVLDMPESYDALIYFVSVMRRGGAFVLQRMEALAE
jgi:hypothetical protein